MEKLKTITKDICTIIVQFFKYYRINDKMFEIPRNLKKMSMKAELICMLSSIIAMLFTFCLKIGNLFIEQKLILLGIVFFLLYRGKNVVASILGIYEASEENKYEFIYQDEITYRVSKIIGTVTDKVQKYDKESGFYRVMSNEEILNSLKIYISNLWQHKLKHKFEVLSLVNVIFLLIITIITNDEIPQYLFITIIVFFSVVSFITSALSSRIRKPYYRKNKECDNEQQIILNDIMRNQPIIRYDIDMRVKKFQSTLEKSNKNTIKYISTRQTYRLVSDIFETFWQYLIIIIYLLNVDFSTITLSTITEITATLVIVETALANISRIARNFDICSERVEKIESEKKVVSKILEVYYKQINKINTSKSIESINLNPFSIKYQETSENDKPFTLVSKEKIRIDKGDVIILSGASGSGKSTFMKLLTERISFVKNVDIPSTSRYLFYDEKLRFGSFSLFEEIFCGEEKPDLDKMQKIMENLHLWQEISSNCIDVWRWLKEKSYGNSLSNGQNQRLILAKMLYWIDENIDVVVLDECTSGLDDKNNGGHADAQKILEYITNECNKDKKRIVIISTHQNVDEFKMKTSNNYRVRDFSFEKTDDNNIVKEV